jgi:polygalacturonase
VEIMKKNFAKPLITAGTLLCLASSPDAAIRNAVSGYGADNTGATYATDKLQNAINACAAGDTLLIPDGTYLMNSGLNLKSDMTVILAKNALVKANTINEWVRNGSSLFDASGKTRVTITGGGAIDGGGLVYPRGTYDKPRPGHGIHLNNCTNSIIRNVVVRNIPTFAVDIVNSSDIVLDSVTIRGRGFANLKGSSDGMDLEGSHHITVTNADIEAGDDGLCLKANDAAHPVHDITMRNCTLASTCNAWKIGTATKGETYNILAENITVNKHSNPGSGNPVPTGDCISAIAVESNDHGRVHHVTVRNFKVNSCYSPIYFDMQNRGSGADSKMDDIVIQNVNVLKAVTQPIIFNWQCGMTEKMKDIRLSKITVHNYGAIKGNNLSCMSGGYPDAQYNGEANAYGIWARGVDGLKLECLDFYDDGNSKRKKFVFDASAQNVDSSAIADCSGVGLARSSPGLRMLLTADPGARLFDIGGRGYSGRGDARATGFWLRKDGSLSVSRLQSSR